MADVSSEISDCVCNSFDFPPTLKYHILEGHAPRQYYYFWIIGTICCVISAFIMIPRIKEIHNEASLLREKMDTALLPYAYQIVSILLTFPLIGAFFNELVLLAPITHDVFVFILNLYNAITLYVFARLVIMYLGSYKSAMNAWRKESTKPTKYYASKPCCCLSICIKERKINKKDFRRIYYGIQQYILVGPTIIFLSLFFRTAINEYYGNLTAKIVATVQVLSSVGCLYASQALLNASRQLLDGYEISGKFKMVQCGIMTLTVPPALLSISGINTKVNDIYTEVVMDEAWSAIISIVLYTLLSVGFRRYFNVETARNAMRNAQNVSYTESLKSKTLIIDLVGGGGADGAYVKFEDENDEMDQEEANDNIETKKLKLIASEHPSNKISEKDANDKIEDIIFDDAKNLKLIVLED